MSGANATNGRVAQEAPVDHSDRRKMSMPSIVLTCE
jgi:hypothetical protein